MHRADGGTLLTGVQDRSTSTACIRRRRRGEVVRIAHGTRSAPAPGATTKDLLPDRFSPSADRSRVNKDGGRFRGRCLGSRSTRSCTRSSSVRDMLIPLVLVDKAILVLVLLMHGRLPCLFLVSPAVRPSRFLGRIFLLFMTAALERRLSFLVVLLLFLFFPTRLPSGFRSHQADCERHGTSRSVYRIVAFNVADFDSRPSGSSCSSPPFLTVLAA